MQKIVYLISEPRYIQRSEPMLRIPKTRIGLYISFQLFGILSCVAISQTLAAIGEPFGFSFVRSFPRWTETHAVEYPGVFNV